MSQCRMLPLKRQNLTCYCSCCCWFSLLFKFTFVDACICVQLTLFYLFLELTLLFSDEKEMEKNSFAYLDLQRLSFIFNRPDCSNFFSFIRTVPVHLCGTVQTKSPFQVWINCNESLNGFAYVLMFNIRWLFILNYTSNAWWQATRKWYSIQI